MREVDALLKAEERFREWTGAGLTRRSVPASGEEVLMKRTFDPNAEETLFSALVGG